MIEEVLSVLLKDLGTTGVLLIGLYFILMRVGRMISKHLYVINHNTSQITRVLEKLTDKYCGK